MNNTTINTISQIPKLGQETAFDKKYAERTEQNACERIGVKNLDNRKCSAGRSTYGHDFLKLFKAQDYINSAENKSSEQSDEKSSPCFMAVATYENTPFNNVTTSFKLLSQLELNENYFETILSGLNRQTFESTKNAVPKDPSSINSANYFLLYLSSQHEPRIKKGTFKKKIFRDLTHKDTDTKKNYAKSYPDDFDELLAF